MTKIPELRQIASESEAETASLTASAKPDVWSDCPSFVEVVEHENRTATIQRLLTAAAAAEAAAGPWTTSHLWSDDNGAPYSYYINNARVHGLPSPAFMAHPIVVGKGYDDPQWKSAKLTRHVTTVGRFITDHLSHHDAGTKEGTYYTPGEVEGGRRLKDKAIRQYLMVFDVDGGIESDDLIANIHQNMPGTGFFFYTSRNHGKMVDGKPLHKCRVVFFLAKPWEIDRGNRSGRANAAAEAAWRALYHGVAKTAGIPCDPACSDLARLFYFGRHPDKADNWRCDFHAGDLLDIGAFKPAPLLEVEKASQRTATKPLDARLCADDMVFGDGVPTRDGWRERLAEIGPHFHTEIFKTALSYFRLNGAEANPEPLRAAVWARVNDLAATGETRDYLTDDYLDTEFRGAIAVISATPGETEPVARACVVEPATIALLGSTPAAPAAVPKLAAPVAPAVPPFATAAEATAFLAADALPSATEFATRLCTKAIGPAARDKLLTDAAKMIGVTKKAMVEEYEEAAKAAQESAVEAAYADASIEAQLVKMRDRYALCRVGGKYRYLDKATRAGELPCLLESDAFHLETRPWEVAVSDANGNTKMEKLSKLYIDWKDRAHYLGLEFEPGDGRHEGFYNLWQGLAVTPTPGDWSLLRAHIFDNICQANAAHFAWLMAWMAQIVQQPGVKLGSAVVVTGRRGTGKSKLFDWLRKVFGAHAVAVSHSSQITGHFNGHHRGLVLLVSEEAQWGGNVTETAALKHIITSPEMQCEPKGLDSFKVSNHVRVAFVANESWIVPAAFGAEEERRFFVLQCGDAKRQDTVYFAAIDQQMEAGGLEAFAHDLLNLPEPDGGWAILRKPPVTAALQEQAQYGMTVAEEIIHEFISDGEFWYPENSVATGARVQGVVVFNESSATEVAAGELREAVHYAARSRGLVIRDGARAIPQAVRKLTGIVGGTVPLRIKLDKVSTRCWRFPALTAIRTHWGTLGLN